MQDIGNITFLREAYFPVCNPEEIHRVLNVKDIKDYLLRVQANTIVDHMRLFRVYRNLAITCKNGWSLEASFDNSHFCKYLSQLPSNLQIDCSPVHFGNIFSTKPNGYIVSSPFGPFITIDETLKHFLRFFHLSFLDFRVEIPMRVRIGALKIALRIMLGTEALDFLMDPRGIIPDDIAKQINYFIPYQLEFICGHEFAHYLEGDLVETQSLSISMSDSSLGTSSKEVQVYSYSQQREFNADIKAFTNLDLSSFNYLDLFSSTILWFGALHLYEVALESISPKSSFLSNSHPSAEDRIRNLFSNVPIPPKFDVENYEQFQESLKAMEDFLLEDISINIESYETYGSCYLDEPGTEWRGKKLIDRVDYY